MKPRISVTLSANAGVAIDIGGRRIWVDALHDRRQPGFSTLSPDLQVQMLRHPHFQHPEYICYTHCHPDHYSQQLTDAAKGLWPNARVIAPEGKYGCIHGNDWRVEDRGLELRFLRLPHEGAQYASSLHYSLLISLEGRHIFVSGDCAVAGKDLAAVAGELAADLLILDFPWVTLPRGNAFLDACFPNVPAVLYHLPFAQDDENGYRASARRCAEARGNTYLLMDPMQVLNLEV